MLRTGDCRQDQDPTLGPYVKVISKLQTDADWTILLYGNRIILPHSIQEPATNLINRGHHGRSGGMTPKYHKVVFSIAIVLSKFRWIWLASTASGFPIVINKNHPLKRFQIQRASAVNGIWDLHSFYHAKEETYVFERINGNSKILWPTLRRCYQTQATPSQSVWIIWTQLYQTF